MKFRLLKQLLALEEANRIYKDNKADLTLTLEHITYKVIPGSTSSVRHDKGKTSTKTQNHAHVFARRNGQGKELYSVNVDGTGHDGYSGTKISATHAEYLRSCGYRIPDNLTLESLSYDSINQDEYEFVVLVEDA